jgi:hypothetical protein
MRKDGIGQQPSGRDSARHFVPGGKGAERLTVCRRSAEKHDGGDKQSKDFSGHDRPSADAKRLKAELRSVWLGNKVNGVSSPGAIMHMRKSGQRD